jgi:hypothetical protein
MRKQLFRRLRPQVVAVAGIVLALGAALPFVLGGTVGAAGERSSTDGATAASLSTSVSAPAVVNVSALPQIVATAPTSGAPKEHLRPLSPLGQTGLTQARAGAQQNAPSAAAAGAMGAMAGPPAATGAATATAAPDTPGGALSSFDGMADSATICSYFGSGCQPPDMGIASNASQVVQFVNTSMGVYSTAGAIQPGFP